MDNTSVRERYFRSWAKDKYKILKEAVQAVLIYPGKDWLQLIDYAKDGSASVQSKTGLLNKHMIALKYANDGKFGYSPTSKIFSDDFKIFIEKVHGCSYLFFDNGNLPPGYNSAGYGNGGSSYGPTKWLKNKAANGKVRLQILGNIDRCLSMKVLEKKNNKIKKNCCNRFFIVFFNSPY